MSAFEWNRLPMMLYDEMRRADIYKGLWLHGRALLFQCIAIGIIMVGIMVHFLQVWQRHRRAALVGIQWVD